MSFNGIGMEMSSYVNWGHQEGSGRVEWVKMEVGVKRRKMHQKRRKLYIYKC